MKKRKVSFGFFALVLAMVFAMVFGACGEAGGADIQGPGLDDEGNPLVDGVSYKVGGEGQAGGIVFYVDPEGFEVAGYGTAYYLEIAPNDIPGKFKFQLVGNNIDGTGREIGTGRNNTAIILNAYPDAPAALACDEYENDGKTDWFLPSDHELRMLRDIGIDAGITGMVGTYWSSSQAEGRPDQAFVTDFGGSSAYTYKTEEYNVRPIRAF